MATRVKNLTRGPYPMPPAYGGVVIEPKQSVIIADTKPNVNAVLQPQPGKLSLHIVPDGQPGAIVPSSSSGGLVHGASSLFEVTAPVAASTTRVSSAGLAASSTTNAFTIAAQPDVPRNVQVAFGGGWDGGNVTVTGTNAQGNTISETLVAVAGSTVVGVNAFKTVTGASKGAVGASSATATIGVGNALGVPAQLANAQAVMLADNAAEPATINTTYNTFTPTVTVPNGSANYALVANL